jgi:hypothetical protein
VKEEEVSNESDHYHNHSSTFFLFYCISPEFGGPRQDIGGNSKKTRADD